jgi:hypothetical protein
VQDGTFKLYVCPFEAKDFPSPHSHYCSYEKCRSYRFDAFQFVKHRRNLGRLKNGRVCCPLSDLSDIRDGIRWMQFVTHGMAKCCTEDFTYLCLRSVCLVNRLQPAFDRNSLYRFKCVRTPLRDNLVLEDVAIGFCDLGGFVAIVT